MKKRGRKRVNVKENVIGEKKREMLRQTRTSCSAAQSQSMPPIKTIRNLKNKTIDEQREYNREMRRNQRAKLSHQKKNAIRKKDRERQRQKRATNLSRALALETPSAVPTLSAANMELKIEAANDSRAAKPRMRQAVYNLTSAFKVKAKQLEMTPQEYAQSTVNLCHPRTPEKKAACLEQLMKQLRSFSQEPYDMEKELGIETVDQPIYGPIEESDNATRSNALHQKVQISYCGDDISRMLPHARYTNKHGPARIMIRMLKDAYELFKKINPEEKIGLTLFQDLRPQNVRLMGTVALDSCLCIYCTNIRLKIGVLNKLLGASGQLPAETSLLSWLTCPLELDEKWPSRSCVDGDCSQCADKIKPFNIFCRDISRREVKWQRWERNGSGKMEPKSKEGVVKDLLKELENDLMPTKGTNFLQHLFTAFWQYSQFKICRSNPEEGEVVMVQDFGENRKAAYSAEIKSAHFGKNQITVHPVVCYFRQGDTVVRNSYIFLSDDCQHDYQAVRKFTDLTLNLLKTHAALTIKKITIWSDGAASQYKGKGTFYDLSQLAHAQRCFYGSEHGKGEADGETGVMSQALKRATYEGHHFRNAKDMVIFLNHRYSNQKRQYVLVDNIIRVDPGVELKTIRGTRAMHQFQRVKDFVIQARKLACFCSACRHNKPQKCLNKETVGDFHTHCLPQSSNNNISEDPTRNGATLADSASERPAQMAQIGDHIKIKYVINGYQKIYIGMVKKLSEQGDLKVDCMTRTSSGYKLPEAPETVVLQKESPEFNSVEVIPKILVFVDTRGEQFFKL